MIIRVFTDSWRRQFTANCRRTSNALYASVCCKQLVADHLWTMYNSGVRHMLLNEESS